MDIEGCHRLPICRNTTKTTKRVIVKFVNRKHSEAMLQLKNDINFKNKVLLPTIYAHTIVSCGESVRIYKGKVGSAKFFVSELL